MSYHDPDLPDALFEEEGRAAPDNQESLLALGVAIGVLRDEAVKARKASGIEDVWMSCEEAYLCIDDLNRHEFTGAKWAKPTSMEGPVTSNVPIRSEMRSTVFVRLTARYVDMGAAKVSEVLLPIDDKPFAFTATPVPDLINSKDDETPIQTGGQPVMINPAPAAEVPGQQPAAAPGQPPAPKPATVGDLAKRVMQKAQDAAEKAETRIYDWMVESNYAAEMRKVINDAARIGVGVLKAPFPDVKTSYAFVKNGDVGKLTIKEKTTPAARWIDPWNLFPHEGCGENIHHGSHIFERDYLSVKQIKELKLLTDIDGHPVYISSQIDKVLQEGPEKCNIDQEDRGAIKPKNKNRFTVWYFTGTLSRKDMLVANAAGMEDLPDEITDVYAVITMVNDSVIRATVNPLDSGRYPYHAMPWSRRAGCWAGVGVAEQVSMPQRTVNASTRALLNNAGFSAGAQIVIDQRSIVPADGRWELSPNKFWWITGEGNADDVRKMFMLLEFPNLGPQLQAIIDLGFKLAEEASNIPLISQGQTGPTTPDTFGAAELQNNNANTLLRAIAYSFDDHITDPVVNQYYEWLLLDPDVPEEEKGDFQINARGSIAMVEKAIQEQTWIRLLSVSVNPAFGMAPAKVAEQILISKRLDPRKVQYTDDEKAQMAQQPPPETPQEKVAKINAAAKEKAQQQTDQTKLQIAGMDTDRDTAYNESLARRDEIARQRAIEDHQMQMQLETLKYANLRQISIDEAKVQLATTAMKLDVQKDLYVAGAHLDVNKTNRTAPQVLTPAVEPAGRAPDGEAFTR
ncbi:hypothetical protein D9M73_65810 [compost metagenome]|nr:MAG TPA: Portal protein [Caudoviricetes sp.]